MTVSELVRKMLKFVPLSFRRRIKHVPGLGRVQGLLVATVLGGHEFVHVVDAGPAKGISFLIRLPEDKGIWTGTYEFDLAVRVAGAIRPSTVAYDIGSWHGFFAGVMAANGAREVHVFEPLPVNADRVQKLIELNPTKSVTLHPIAVGETDTEMDLLVMPETSMAKLEASRFQPHATSQQRVPIYVRSLDSMVLGGEVPPPSLLKIDVEGAELIVLQGARTTLRTHRPEIFVEIHSVGLLEQCTCFLKEEGYQIERLCNSAAQSTDIYWIRAFAPA